MKDIYKDESYTLPERQLDFLADTVNYFSVNPRDRRCVEGSSTCRYYPIKPTTDGCAIGRHMTKKNQLLADDAEFGGIDWLIEERPNLFPGWMVSLGKEFLATMQSLHDTVKYWTESELSQEGEAEFENIVKYILNYK